MRFLKTVAACGVVLLAGLRGVAGVAPQEPGCSNCAVWNVPQTPFKIFADTYYVGPHGLASILVASDAGLVLIDGALPESATQIAANIRTLGFDIKSVRLILNSHAHFDHAGGIAELQRLSGAEVVVSPWSAAVMRAGGVGKDDPQLGDIRGIAKVARVRTIQDGQAVRLGQLTLTAHFTPGHTPGGTSWTWRQCEGARCLDLVYADSISPVAAPGFRFTDSKAYPGAVTDFEKSFAFLSATPCDVLLTPHGEASGFWERVAARQKGVVGDPKSAQPDPMVDGSLCRKLADTGREQLRKRLATEAGQPTK